MARGRTAQPAPRFPILLLLVAALAVVLSSASVISAYAMPVEARTTEPWYSYQASVGFDFQARVKQGKFYADPVMKPDQLMSIRGPVEPPVYRRVLIGKFTDAIEVKIPYKFKADRPAPLKAKWRVDGMMQIPGLWQQPYPIMTPKEFNTTGAEIAGVETFTISIAKILADMETNRTQYGIQVEPVEIHIKPTLQVEATGLKEPVQFQSSGEFIVTVRSTTVEVDDAREIKSDKAFAETKIVPITVSFFGSNVTVALIRQVSVVALVAFLLLASVLVWMRRKKPDNRSLLQKLGPNLITARAFELPGDVAVVDVRTAKELLQLQAQTERPVIRVGSVYYLQDGSTCYRLNLGGEGDD